LKKPIKSKSIYETVFSVIDVETTGMSAKYGRITEIGVVKISNGQIVEEFSSLIDPQQFIPVGITHLTGITNDMVYGKPKFEEVYPKLKKIICESSDVFVGHNASFDFGFVNESLDRINEEKCTLPTLCTCRLARRLNQKLPSKSLSSLSKFFRLKRRRSHRAIDDAKATAQILIHFIDRLIEEFHVETLNELLAFQYRKIYGMNKIPKSLMRIKVDLQNVPERPGVYFMKNKKEDVIYIGKAKNLKDRISSYFYHNVSHTRKVKRLIGLVRKFDYEVTNSELSALMLESSLIKLHKPKYNSAIRKYRRMPFIKLDVQHDYPRVIKTYEMKADGAKYYGPFRSSLTVNSLIDRINKSYKLRKCDDVILKPSVDANPCMYHEIDQCNAPCNFTQSRKEYNLEVRKIENYISFEGSGAVKQLENKMNELAEKTYFEEASFVRDELLDLKKVVLNIELTSSEINLKNYVLKCRDYSRENTFEIFFVINGKLVHKFVIDSNVEIDEDEERNLLEEIQNFYFGGSLFSELSMNLKQKYTVQELDQINIITNWICLNNTQSIVFKVTHQSKLKDILKFIYGAKHRHTKNLNRSLKKLTHN